MQTCLRHIQNCVTGAMSHSTWRPWPICKKSAAACPGAVTLFGNGFAGGFEPNFVPMPNGRLLGAVPKAEGPDSAGLGFVGSLVQRCGGRAGAWEPPSALPTPLTSSAEANTRSRGSPEMAVREGRPLDYSKETEKMRGKKATAIKGTCRSRPRGE